LSTALISRTANIHRRTRIRIVSGAAHNGTLSRRVWRLSALPINTLSRVPGRILCR
jgi:hypothetical protein